MIIQRAVIYKKNKTKTQRRQYLQQVDACVCGSRKPETNQHIRMESKGIHAVRPVGIIHLHEALEFKMDGSIQRSAVEINKGCLEYCWKKSRADIFMTGSVTGTGSGTRQIEKL